jgi:hypothetical protein
MKRIGKSEVPMLKRIVSLEGAMGLFGIYSPFSGLVDGEKLQVFWGVAILAGLLTLTPNQCPRKPAPPHLPLAFSPEPQVSSPHPGPCIKDPLAET